MSMNLRRDRRVIDREREREREREAGRRERVSL